MTVKELIEELAKLPQDLTVTVGSYDYYGSLVYESATEVYVHTDKYRDPRGDETVRITAA